jgi:hypothetical protein
LFFRAFAVDALGDVGRLLADAGQHRAGSRHRSRRGVVVADTDHGVAHDLVDVDPRRRGDFAGQTTPPVLIRVSQATRALVSSAIMASSTASEIWSAILSGCPSETDSEVNS